MNKTPVMFPRISLLVDALSNKYRVSPYIVLSSSSKPDVPSPCSPPSTIPHGRIDATVYHHKCVNKVSIRKAARLSYPLISNILSFHSFTLPSPSDSENSYICFFNQLRHFNDLCMQHHFQLIWDTSPFQLHLMPKTPFRYVVPHD
jgi:hypothetical protein